VPSDRLLADPKIGGQGDDRAHIRWDRCVMAHWTTHTTSDAAPDRVLDVLTDPAAIREWSPIPFDLDELDGERLEAGSRARVSGSLAGLQVGFDVEVHAADEAGLELTAKGPIGIDVRYELAPRHGGSDVTASVSLHRGRGLTGRLMERATGALLSAGALDGAAGRIARAA
jgi:polyketide cyclase/dehydrase/lipid transport protein